MGFISTAYLGLINLLRICSGVVVFTIFVLICTDVFMRLAGLQPWLYISIIVEYGLLWFTMLAAPWLARVKGHVFIDAVTQLMPPGVQWVAAKLTYLICIVSCGVFAFFSALLLNEAIVTEQIDSRAVDVPQWILLVPLPFAFGMVAIEFVRFFIGIDSMYGDRTDVKDNV